MDVQGVSASSEQVHIFGLGVFVQVPKGMESRCLGHPRLPLFAPSFVAGFRASLQQ
jgi:hypothetical protein